MQHNPRFLAFVNEVRQRVNEVDVHQVKRWMEQNRPFVLLDVREESEWAKGHLPSAQYLGRGILERDIETRYPELNTPLVLYCGGGFRSVLAADNLQQMGYRDVISMDGGYRGWVEANYPVEEDF
ncbi:rhodanese-like domain-containing protein [uncultured Tolumonas sp.]|jgi:rhodanese-related sulfurtransferase|uniref:rhodanese-like domain-containing protein n=1 Tax=uncultured Tolumonas sp. TaxID=263765 RepID=UPI00292E6295|nr:rhodanese-like domain-containing protein [uncultured Tolumonas sp.]MDD2842488.1 rhodanese-like domain-containing protein [Tolumonas sp.]